MTPVSIFPAHVAKQAACMAMTIEGFGERLALALAARELTQGELSRRARVRPETISRYVAGQTPRLPELIAIADALECSIDWLVRGQVEPTDDETAASIEWAIGETGLDERGAFVLREVCRRIGPMDRGDVFTAATRIASNAADRERLPSAHARR